jgi:hypothetical protein
MIQSQSLNLRTSLRNLDKLTLLQLERKPGNWLEATVKASKQKTLLY